jgi:ABC-type sugar transport system substrate-binding protein
MAALKVAGLGHVIVIGFDGRPDAIASIKAKEIRATVLQPAAAIARMAVDQADRLITKPLTSQAIGVLLRNRLYAGIVDVPEYDFATSAVTSKR